MSMMSASRDVQRQGKMLLLMGDCWWMVVRRMEEENGKGFKYSEVPRRTYVRILLKTSPCSVASHYVMKIEVTQGKGYDLT